MCTCACVYGRDLSDIDWDRTQELEVTDSEMKAVPNAYVSVFIVAINVDLFRYCSLNIC
jgi:hypothetical protein